MELEFKAEEKTLQVLNADKELVEYEVEYRWDPLTGKLCVLCPYLEDKWEDFYAIDEDFLDKIVEDSKENCIFCKPLIDDIAAKFPEEQLPEDRLRFKDKDIYVFPNLYPRADFEAVVTSPKFHHLRLNEFRKDLWRSYLQASMKCIRKVRHRNEFPYSVIGCNYLPPAGASLMHFHLQITMQEEPFPYLKDLLDSQGNWKELKERNQDREIKNDNLYWYSPFAPQGFYEIRALNEKNWWDFNEEEIEEIARGLSNLLQFYHDKGFISFNLALFSGENFSGLRLVSRPNLQENYTSIDTWYMPFLMQQAVVLKKPEELAEEARGYF